MLRQMFYKQTSLARHLRCNSFRFSIEENRRMSAQSTDHRDTIQLSADQLGGQAQ
jgi:hypothetical protein